MIQTNDMSYYDVADALQIDLHQMPDGRVRGFETKKLQIGPWALDGDVSVVGDIRNDAVVSFFAKVLGNLWLYVVRDSQGLHMHVFDGSTVKLHVKDCASFGGKTVADTLKKLNAGLVTAYDYDYAAHEWVELSDTKAPGDLVHSAKPESVVKLIAGPETAA